MEAELRHRFGVKQIASVEDDRCRHLLFHDGEIDIPELRPFRGDDQGFRTLDRVHRRAGEFRAGDCLGLPRLFHGFRIEGRHLRSFLQHVGDQFHGDRGPEIVGIRFEGETPDRNFLVA